MAFRTIISPAALATSGFSFTIVDCRFKLDDVDWGEWACQVGHIPGAVYAHLDRHLSGPKTGTNGRHPLPDLGVAAVTFWRLGITGGKQVVVYDQDHGMFASRLWWLLRWLGHDAVAVLDGGLAKWLEEGRPMSTTDDSHEAVAFHPAPRAGMQVTAADVDAHRRDPAWRVIDARAPERYRGEIEPVDPVAGHIPGASGHFFQLNLDEHGTLRTPADLRLLWAPLLGDVPPPDQIVCYCGSGVQASQNVLALEHASISGAKLYPGSWSEWVSDPARPVESRTGLPGQDDQK